MNCCLTCPISTRPCPFLKRVFSLQSAVRKSHLDSLLITSISSLSLLCLSDSLIERPTEQYREAQPVLGRRGDQDLAFTSEVGTLARLLLLSGVALWPVWWRSCSTNSLEHPPMAPFHLVRLLMSSRRLVKDCKSSASFRHTLLKFERGIIHLKCHEACSTRQQPLASFVGHRVYSAFEILVTCPSHSSQPLLRTRAVLAVPILALEVILKLHLEVRSARPSFSLQRTRLDLTDLSWSPFGCPSKSRQSDCGCCCYCCYCYCCCYCLHERL